MPPSNQSPEPRKQLPSARGLAWIREGFDLFKAAPGPWLVLTLLWLGILLGLAAVPLGSLISSILSPVFLGGALMGCHALRQNQPLKAAQLFACFSNGQFGPLVRLGLLGLAAQFLIMLAAAVLMFPTLAPAVAGGHISLGAILVLPVLLGILLATVLMLPLAMALWFAPALVALGDVPPVDAMKLSLAASWHNMGAFTVYGLVMLVLIVIAVIPFGLGLLLAGPIIIGSIYAAYRDIFGDEKADVSPPVNQMSNFQA